MSIEKIIGFLRGYVEIYAVGLFTERFLNVCMRREIYLWDIKRRGKHRISACISIRGFKLLRPIAKKTRTSVKITRRHGLPFIFHRYRHRKTAAIGLFLFLAVLWYLSSHIMGISISGNTRIPTEEIERNLKSSGIYYGASVKKIDSEMVKNQMMISLDDLSWIGVSIKGSRAYIEVKERLDTKRLDDTDIPCDIVANRDGTIVLLEVKNGQTMVKVNQFVTKGDLLVSGLMDSEKVGMRYVHSFGEIFAETSYKKSGEYSFDFIEKIYSGKTKNRYTLSLLGKRFSLFNTKKSPFPHYDKEEKFIEYTPPLTFLPSAFVKTESFAEYTPKKRERTQEETIAFAEKELFALLDAEIPKDAEVLDKKITWQEAGERRILVTAEYLCCEDIARQRKIDKIEILDYDKE
ncbi:MAG: sporulation protein YqfD [Clostridia bacterium]|nr:sporulation protein YqfD [Clostridia bacterium]